MVTLTDAEEAEQLDAPHGMRFPVFASLLGAASAAMCCLTLWLWI